jgi:hypothetical protein
MGEHAPPHCLTGLALREKVACEASQDERDNDVGGANNDALAGRY